MQVAIAARRVHAGRGRRAAPRDGAQAQPRADGGDLPADARRHGEERHRAEDAAPDLQPDQRLRRLRISREPRGELRAARLRVGVPQALLRARVHRGDPQRAADGVLRAGHAGGGRAAPRRGGAAGGRDALGVGRDARAARGAHAERDEGRGEWRADPRRVDADVPPTAPAVRLGLRSVRGLGATARDRLERGARGGTVHVDRRRGAALGTRPARAAASRRGGRVRRAAAARARRAAAARRALGAARRGARRRRPARARDVAVAERAQRGAAPLDDARRAHGGRLSHDRDLARRPSDGRTCGRCSSRTACAARWTCCATGATASASPRRGS